VFVLDVFVLCGFFFSFFLFFSLQNAIFFKKLFPVKQKSIGLLFSALFFLAFTRTTTHSPKKTLSSK